MNLRVLPIVIPLLAALCAGQAQAPIAQSSPIVLPQNAQQVATIIGATAYLERLPASRHESDSGTAPVRWEEVFVRQQIYNTVLAASLDVDSVVAEIDNESSLLADMRSQLQARTDKAVATTNIANIIAGTGGGIIGTAMQLSNHTAQAGNIIGTTAGATSTALQFLALHQQHGPAVPIGRVPNMLAPFFGRPTYLHAMYPQDVWQYLNSRPGGLSSTRIELLTAEWQSSGRLPKTGGLDRTKTIELLTTSMDQNVKIDADTLTNRIAMLSEVRGRVLLMKRDLADLLRSLNANP